MPYGAIKLLNNRFIMSSLRRNRNETSFRTPPRLDKGMAHSGSVLSAQLEAIEQFARQQGLEFQTSLNFEIGKSNDALTKRAGLDKALKYPKTLKSPMIVSKLKRLSLHVEFIAEFMTIRIFSMWLRAGPLEPPSSLSLTQGYGQGASCSAGTLARPTRLNPFLFFSHRARVM